MLKKKKIREEVPFYPIDPAGFVSFSFLIIRGNVNGAATLLAVWDWITKNKTFILLKLPVAKLRSVPLGFI